MEMVSVNNSEYSIFFNHWGLNNTLKSNYNTESIGIISLIILKDLLNPYTIC